MQAEFIHNYIFDLDGTLIDSSNQVLFCLEHALISAGVLFDKSKLTSNVIGPPLVQIIKNVTGSIDENLISKVLVNFRNDYDNLNSDISTLYFGAYDVLKELSKNNKTLFIATFKPKISTFRILKQYKIDKYFKDIYTIDKFSRDISKEEMLCDIISRYNLDISKTAMLGDALGDMLAAKSAGILSLAALWGYGDDKTELIKNADYVLKDIKELLCLKLNCRITLQKD